MNPIISITFLFLISGCDNTLKFSSLKANQEKEEKKMTVENSKNQLNTNDTKSQIYFSEKQRDELKLITENIIDVISKKNSLEIEEINFGKGKDKSPKESGPPLVRSYHKELQANGFGVTFKRRDGNQTWYQASFGFYPRNYPIGVYKMNLSREFFSSFSFEKSHNEERPLEPVKNVNIFEYFYIKNEIKLKLIFEARADVSKLNEQYPNSFHYVEITSMDQ